MGSFQVLDFLLWICIPLLRGAVMLLIPIILVVIVTVTDIQTYTYWIIFILAIFIPLVTCAVSVIYTDIDNPQKVFAKAMYPYIPHLNRNLIKELHLLQPLKIKNPFEELKSFERAVLRKK